MKPFSILDNIRGRVAEAILAQSGLNHAGLRTHLRAMLSSSDAGHGAMLREPVLEGAHPFVTAVETFGDMEGKQLTSELVEALDGGTDPRARNYRFGRTAHPFKHQVEAWEALMHRDPQSVLVTSGTGSGKTECFLIPILDDLVRRTRETPLVGVEAIMLYPLNALIESQRERLNEWTAPFGGRVRYALYNSNLPDDASSADARLTPWEVLDRRTLRDRPPPILVTNITMLEYILARGADRPILDASQGKLKWIVLDEAHSLVGAAAAEVALLLRRVMLGFGVDHSKVRFVATSATIGSGDRVLEDLRAFLANVAGISGEQVSVIEGHRRMPPAPIELAPIVDRPLLLPTSYTDLAGRRGVWPMVQRLYRGAVPASEYDQLALSLGVNGPDLAMAMATTRSEQVGGGAVDALAPMRVHAFQRAMPGLWSCVNPECAGRVHGWQFGRLLTEKADVCPSCQALVFEVQSCSGCGRPALVGYDDGTRVHAQSAPPPEDEFRDDAERDRDTEADDGDGDLAVEGLTSRFTLYFFATSTEHAHRITIDRLRGVQTDANAENALTLAYDEPPGGRGCPCCGEVPKSGNALRPMRFGSPFLMGNSAPILLAGLEPEPADRQPLPAGGRRLLSFTDSRQGTARMSAKLQIDAERNFVRSLIYHIVQEGLRPAQGAASRAADLRAQIAAMDGIAILAGPREQLVADLRSIEGGDQSGLSWADTVNRLAEAVEVSDWISQVWEPRGPEFADPTKLANFLLLREFSRRPQRANSIETLGLARLVSPDVERLTEAQVPHPFLARGKSLTDWKSFLNATLTHFVRANGAIGIDEWAQHWIMPKASTKRLAGPTETPDRSRNILRWPSVSNLVGRSRPILLLSRGLGLDVKERSDRDDIEECLREAYSQLRPALTRPASAYRALAFETMRIAPVTSAYWCPVTRRTLNEAAFGLSPFGLDRLGTKDVAAEAIEFPALPETLSGRSQDEEKRQKIAAWLESNGQVASLRERGAWNNLTDRAALFADYARAAEHSAQQEPITLRDYERQFRAGEINILSCSTTMEMGVDIGSVSAVMMTNVPPSIANYRQRVGRAGRRGQPLSLALTFCKDRPLDREAFRDPIAFLGRSVAAPRVALDSRPIVQRHVNAYLLSAFIHEHGGESIKMTAGDFFGCPGDARMQRSVRADRIVSQFAEWTGLPTTRSAHNRAVGDIVASSILSGDRGLFEACHAAILQVEKDFADEWESLRSQAKPEAMEREAARTAVSFELQRLSGDFLLSTLSDRGFLPGHGFPTDVVSFQTGVKPKRDFAQQRENRFRTRGGPQRSLDLAIRDYAPGAEVVVDGLVYTSAGVTLNWKRPANDESVREVQSLRTQWQCSNCGTGDIAAGSAPDACPSCGHPALRMTRYLRPAGFTVDSRERPHAQIDEVAYVKPADPEVSTRDAQWLALPDPDLGRHRSSREGLVFYSSRGSRGHGYAICLDCGRAAAEHGEGVLPTEMEQHFPLRGRQETSDGRCSGNARPFAIQRELALGHEITTDVFEIQPALAPREGAANALVIALREAIAMHLGIEAQEMGFSVTASTNHLNGRTRSLLLFDRAAGGGGFCTSASASLDRVLELARGVLDCETPGCDTGCPNCVLVSDAPEGEGKLDRKAALAFLDSHLRLDSALAPDDMVGPYTGRSVSLPDEVHKALSLEGEATLTVWLPSLPKVGGFQNWSVLSQVEDWGYHGRQVRLALPPDSISAMDGAQKLGLRDLAIATKARLFVGPAPAFGNSALPICAVTGRDARSTVWAGRDAAAAEAGEAWGRPGLFPIVHTTLGTLPALLPVALDDLLPAAGTQFKELRGELDGAIAQFGTTTARLLVDLLRKAGSWGTSPLVRMVYQDPYITSPLAARLLVDTLAGVAKFGKGGALVSIETQRAGERGDGSRQPVDISHDWSDAQEQSATVRDYARLVGLNAELVHRQVPHGRFLTLEFADGRRARLVLDQGFGAWRLPHGARIRHAFGNTPRAQAELMARWNASVARRGTGTSYVVAL